MTNKRSAAKLGKEVRRATGLPFTVAMRIGKKLSRNFALSVYSDPSFEGMTDWERGCMDPQCNCKDRFYFRGPKGRFQISGPRD